MRRLLLGVLIVGAMGFVAYEVRGAVRAARRPTLQWTRPADPAKAGWERIGHDWIPPRSASTPAAWRRAEHPEGAKAPPGTYVPAGFHPRFREMIVYDFSQTIDAKLGKDWPVEKRAAVAKIQNDLWDEHGPNVDLYHDKRISQPEYAERTHAAFLHYSEAFAKLLSDEEFEKLFDVPRGTDFYYVLFHSPSEQPGLPVNTQTTAVPVADHTHDPPPPPMQSPPPPPAPTSSEPKGFLKK